jgi:hypothetical protein
MSLVPYHLAVNSALPPRQVQESDIADRHEREGEGVEVGELAGGEGADPRRL